MFEVVKSQINELTGLTSSMQAFAHVQPILFVAAWLNICDGLEDTIATVSVLTVYTVSVTHYETHLYGFQMLLQF